ncbi:hypothetical protein C8Q76DRAFT_627574, partial [Earliella scabrosa]
MASFPSLSLYGSYDGRPVSVLIDPLSPYSRLSTSFVLSQNVPRSLSQDGPLATVSSSCQLALPTTTGWYRSCSRLPVEYVRGHDVVLGGDWFNVVSPVTACGVLLDPPVNRPYPIGFHWEP